MVVAFTCFHCLVCGFYQHIVLATVAPEVVPLGCLPTFVQPLGFPKVFLLTVEGLKVGGLLSNLI